MQSPLYILYILFSFNIFSFIFLLLILFYVFSLLFSDGKTMFDSALINNFLEMTPIRVNFSNNKINLKIKSTFFLDIMVLNRFI